MQTNLQPVRPGRLSQQRVSIRSVLATMTPGEISSTEPKKLMPFTKMDPLDHSNEALRMLEMLFDKAINTDVVFKLDDGSIRAHRVILALQSPVFNQMLNGANDGQDCTIAKSSPITLPGKRCASFRVFLKYLYTGHFDLPQLDLDIVIDVLFISNEYKVIMLTASIASLLTKIIDADTVCHIFEAALALETNKILLEKCREFLCDNAKAVLKSPNFLDLSLKAITDIISRDSFAAPEIDILMAVSQWYDRHRPVDLHDLLKNIRFDHISLDGLTMIQVAPLYELLVCQHIDLKKIGKQSKGGAQPIASRARLMTETENKATTQLGAAVLTEGDPVNPTAMLSGNYKDIDTKHCTYHSGIGSYIAVKLDKVYRVDSMLIIVKNTNSLAFTVETSLDFTFWEQLADCKPGNQLQFSGSIVLIFPPRQLQYIKLTGQADYDWFFVQHFECPTNVTSEERDSYRKFNQNGLVVAFLRDCQRVVSLPPCSKVV